jgi:hypothetical protein
MAHAAAARENDQDQQFERVVVHKEKGINGWHASLSADQGREDQGLRKPKEGGSDMKANERQAKHATGFELQRCQCRQLPQRFGLTRQRTTKAEIQRRRQLAHRLGQPCQRRDPESSARQAGPATLEAPSTHDIH